MKSYSQFLQETPPPDDWDRDVFKQSFKAKIEYAKQKAAKIGSGSSRVAFVVDYQGRPTVLKIAKNRKGLAQNEQESDWGLYQMYPDLIIPIIDFDEENDPPTWVHFEKAEKLTEQKFAELTGYDFEVFGYALVNFLNRRRGRSRYRFHVDPEIERQLNDDELFNSVIDLCVNFDLMAQDFMAIQNWGLYQGRPVIIDVGFSSSVAKDHYKFNP